MDHRTFSLPERGMAFIAGIFNLVIGLAFFFLPEVHLPLWPTSIPHMLDRFIGAIGACGGSQRGLLGARHFARRQILAADELGAARPPPDRAGRAR